MHADKTVKLASATARSSSCNGIMRDCRGRLRGVFVGCSRLVLAPPSRRLWFSVLSAADCCVHLWVRLFPFGATIQALGCHSFSHSLGVLTLTWSALVVIASSTKLAPGVVPKVCLPLSPHLSSFLTSFPVRHLVWSSSVTTPQDFRNSTSHVAAVRWELGLALGRSLGLVLCAMDDSSSRPPDPASVFRLCSTVQGT